MLLKGFLFSVVVVIVFFLNSFGRKPVSEDEKCFSFDLTRYLRKSRVSVLC